MAIAEKNGREQAVNGSPWIYGPWLDLIVGCGAWSAPLLLISYLSIASSTRIWAITFYALALFFNYPHYMATIYRAYHRAEDFHKYRIFTVHITALIVLTILLSHSWSRILPWIFTIYLTWSPWHYSGQNYGLFMMFARRAGAKPSENTRRALYSAFIASYLILFLGFHTGVSNDPLFLSLGIPAVVSRWEQAILIAAFIGLSVFGLTKLVVETGWRKIIPSLTLFSSQVLWFLLPACISLLKAWQIPQTRYSSGVLAVMHSAQYLWITSYYARREETREGGGNWRGLAYFGVLIAGGIALFIPGPWLASRVFHHDYTSSFLIFTALVNIHHFILDGAIWKLRDGRIAALLLNSGARATGVAYEAGNRLATGLAWLTGKSPAAHRLRISATCILLFCGTVEEVRYYLALHTSSLQDLQRAEVLDPFDSSLQMRLGRKEFEEGKLAPAEAAWRRAMQTNPADPAPRQALLKFLIEQKRFDEAFDLTDVSLKYTPKDANLLMDRGLLALRRGESGLAVDSLNRAIAIDPGQTLAQLYLATELDHEGKSADAALHYRAFLARIAQLSAENRPQPEKVIAIALRMAACQASASQAGPAIESYRLAAKIASQTKQPKLESIADVNAADLEAKNGNVAAALELYQHTLQLDESSGDQVASAEDWFAYGRFLENSHFSPRLVYACFVKSRALQDSNPDVQDHKALADASAQAARTAGSDATAIRRDPEPFLKAAMVLRP
jgi:tetratricopeptide (TPR) repeat protein